MSICFVLISPYQICPPLSNHQVVSLHYDCYFCLHPSFYIFHAHKLPLFLSVFLSLLFVCFYYIICFFLLGGRTTQIALILKERQLSDDFSRICRQTYNGTRITDHQSCLRDVMHIILFLIIIYLYNVTSYYSYV